MMPLNWLDTPEFTEFDMVARTKRSRSQQGTYRKALTRAVEATGRWQSRDAPYTALKVKLGYVEPIFDLQGRVIGMKPDSTAFDAMPHKDFSEYMTKAMAALSGSSRLRRLGDGWNGHEQDHPACPECHVPAQLIPRRPIDVGGN